MDAVEAAQLAAADPAAAPTPDAECSASASSSSYSPPSSNTVQTTEGSEGEGGGSNSRTGDDEWAAVCEGGDRGTTSADVEDVLPVGVDVDNENEPVGRSKRPKKDLNYDLVGWIDWNLCLDKRGGPNWAGIHVGSPIIVFPEDEFVKQPMFYAMGHFSKWIPRGSVRLRVEERKRPSEKKLENVAFLTPRNTIVLVVHNKGKARIIRVQLGGEHTVLDLETASITTMEFLAPS